jgi:hypothetical protein
MFDRVVLYSQTGNQNRAMHYNSWNVDLQTSTQVNAYYNERENISTSAEAVYEIQIALTPRMNVVACCLYSNEHAFFLKDAGHQDDFLGFRVPEGTYRLFLCYESMPPTEKCYFVVVRDNIIINAPLKIEVWADEAIHEVSTKFFYENSSELPMDGTVLFDALFGFEILNTYCEYITVSNAAPCINISDVNLADFQLFNVNFVYPRGIQTNPPTDNTFYMVVNNPKKTVIDQKVSFSNDYHNFTHSTFQFPQKEVFNADFIVSDIRFGSLMPPYYIGSQTNYRYYVDSLCLLYNIKEFNTAFQPFFQPVCSYSESEYNANLQQTMLGRIKPNIFTFEQSNTLLLNRWMDFDATTPLSSSLSLDNNLMTYYPDDYEFIFGQESPVFFIQHNNGGASGFSVESKVYPFGRHGEWREIDYRNGHVQFFCDEELLFDDTLYKWRGLETDKRRDCKLTITSSHSNYDNQDHYSIVTADFNQRLEDANPPTLTMFRVKNEKGYIAHEIKDFKNSKIECAAGDFVYIDNKWSFQKKPKMEVFWSVNGENTWLSLEIQEDVENFDSTTGNFFVVSLSTIEHEKPSWIDIRIVCTDEAGNKVSQDFLPAFYSFLHYSAVSENTLTSKGIGFAFPNPFSDWIQIKTEQTVNGNTLFVVKNLWGQTVYSKAEYCINKQEFLWNVRETAGKTIPNGIYLYILYTDDDMFSGKIIKQ